MLIVLFLCWSNMHACQLFHSTFLVWTSYWAGTESLRGLDLRAPSSERFEPTEAPRLRPEPKLEVLWCLQRKEPAWVVGEQRQFFHLDFEASCDVGEASIWECFLKSSMLNSGMVRFWPLHLILGVRGFCSTFPAILVCQLQEKRKKKQLTM